MTRSAEALYLERLAFDIPDAVDELTDKGPLERIIEAANEYVVAEDASSDEVAIRHIGPDGHKVNRIRLNILEHLDLMRNPSLVEQPLEAVEKALLAVPSLTQTLDIAAEGLNMTHPTIQGHRFIEFEVSARYRKPLVDEANDARSALSLLTGTEISARVTRPRIRLAWIKPEAADGLAEELFDVVEDEFRLPMGIRLEPALPLGREEPSDLETQSSGSLPETIAITGQNLLESIEFIRSCLRHADEAATEAEARGNTAPGRLEQTVSQTMRDKAAGCIELLGIMNIEPLDGAANWQEVIDGFNK